MSEQFKISALLWDVRRSARYHRRRQAFFETTHNFTAASGLIFSSAAVVSIIKTVPTLAAVFSATVVVLSILDLVVGNSRMATLHNDLARRFVSLEKCIISAGHQADRTNELHAERLKIEADEPPIKRVLDVICHNELVRCTLNPKNWKDNCYPVTTLQYLSRNFLCDYKPRSALPHQVESP